MSATKEAPKENRRPVTLVLTPAQEQDFLRQFTGDQGISNWLIGQANTIYEQINVAAIATVDEDDHRLSRSLLRGLSLLGALWPHGSEYGVVELAHKLKLSPSTTHRYVTTLVETGLVERSGKSRQYRLAQAGKGSPQESITMRQ